LTTVDTHLASLDTFDLASSAEWRTLCARQHNILLEGPQVATEAMVAHLSPYLREPVAWQDAGTPSETPIGDTGALVVRDIAALSASGQERLLRWLGGPGNHQHVVATTTEPLFPRVALGEFDETLYYRLNVIMMKVDAAPAIR
jgi:hypothetical protein